MYSGTCSIHSFSWTLIFKFFSEPNQEHIQHVTLVLRPLSLAGGVNRATCGLDRPQKPCVSAGCQATKLLDALSSQFTSDQPDRDPVLILPSSSIVGVGSWLVADHVLEVLCCATVPEGAPRNTLFFQAGSSHWSNLHYQSSASAVLVAIHGL